MNQTQRTLQEYRSTLSPAEVLREAKSFFQGRSALYSTFLEQESATHVSFRGQGGEEVIIAAAVKDGATLVTGSTYLFDMQIARFFTTLPSFESTETLLPAGTSAGAATAVEVRA